mgnify:CR=1 FL=1
MKLYVWPNVETLRDWDTGEVLALAHSKEQAIEIACTSKWVLRSLSIRFVPESGETRRRSSEILLSTYEEELREELQATEPMVIEKPWAWVQKGSA